MRRLPVLLALLLLPQGAVAQRTAFSSLLGGYVSYRPTVAWRVTRLISDPQREGVLLAPRAAPDSGVSALLIAYRRTGLRTFQALTDSLLAALSPSPNAQRIDDRSADSTRIVIWRTDGPEGRVIAIDRILLLPEALVYARVAMPAITPAKPDDIPLRLEQIDDLLTTVHAEGRVLFPYGAGFGVKVY